MSYHYPLYSCFPAVAKVGTPTRVAIVPEGTCRFFKEDRDYEIWIGGMREDLLDYHDPLEPNAPCKVEGGYLWFTFTFENEMMYSVRFREKGGSFTEIFMYAVREDLYKLRPLKGDLHAHSYYSDGDDDVAMTAADYRENGYDFCVLSDHNRYYTSLMLKEAYKDVQIGLNVINAEEVHTPGSDVHIVHVGGRESVADIYLHHADVFEAEVADIIKELPEKVPELYRSRLAKAIWTCRKIHEFGGIAIFPHPFWKANVYNVSEELCDLLFDANIFDAFELMGGTPTTASNMQLGLWQAQRLKGNNIAVVGSSDSHYHAFPELSDDLFARNFTIAFAEDNTPEGVMNAIKNNMSVAGELSKYDQGEVRFYGDYRLTSYAHFLYDHYFRLTRLLFAGEGSMMRRYINEQLNGAWLSQLKDEGDKFYREFFGQVEKALPSAKRLAYRDKWRKIQIEQGPPTNGGCLYLYGGGRNKARE